MRTVTNIKEIHDIELNIMKYIDRICEEYDITYYLYGGTLIGAIRHKGFIPWDDDFDICMPRPDYNRFVKLMKKNESERFSFKCIENGKKRYNYCFGKMIDNNTIVKEEGKFEGEELGVWVDVFPIDGVGDDLEKAKSIIEKNRKIVNQILNLEYGKTINLKGKILYLLGRKKLYRVLKHNMMKNDFYNSKYVTDIGTITPNRIWHSNSMRESVRSQFEDCSFYIPIDSDDYLKAEYGDYMKLPPEDERVQTHNLKVILK